MLRLAALWGTCFCALFARAEQPLPSVHIAVASNFLSTLVSVQANLEHDCSCVIHTTSASSGMLSAQWAQGAPFDVFLSADRERPQWLYKQGLTQKAPQTYALGTLALIDLHRDSVGLTDIGVAVPGAQTLRLGIANPVLAPYGKAAASLLDMERSDISFIKGNNVLQVMQFVLTGAVDQALVSGSLLAEMRSVKGSSVRIPPAMHPKIVQQAVINKKAHTKESQCVITKLRSKPYQAQLADRGYLPFELGDVDPT